MSQDPPPAKVGFGNIFAGGAVTLRPTTTRDSSPEDSSMGEVVQMAEAEFEYDAEQEDELSFKEGDMITVINKEVCDGWAEGKLNGRSGVFPNNFVRFFEKDVALKPEVVKPIPSPKPSRAKIGAFNAFNNITNGPPTSAPTGRPTSAPTGPPNNKPGPPSGAPNGPPNSLQPVPTGGRRISDASESMIAKHTMLEKLDFMHGGSLPRKFGGSDAMRDKSHSLSSGMSAADLKKYAIEHKDEFKPIKKGNATPGKKVFIPQEVPQLDILPPTPLSKPQRQPGANAVAPAPPRSGSTGSLGAMFPPKVKISTEVPSRGPPSTSPGPPSGPPITPPKSAPPKNNALLSGPSSAPPVTLPKQVTSGDRPPITPPKSAPPKTASSPPSLQPTSPSRSRKMSGPPSTIPNPPKAVNPALPVSPPPTTGYFKEDLPPPVSDNSEQDYEYMEGHSSIDELKGKVESLEESMKLLKEENEKTQAANKKLIDMNRKLIDMVMSDVDEERKARGNLTIEFERLKKLVEIMQ